MTRDTVTPDRARALTRAAGGKFNARRTWVGELGRWFASGYEAEVAVGLWRRQQAGEIRNLRFQVPYPLVVEGAPICRYVADFVYEEQRPTDPGTPGHGHLRYWSSPVVADAKSPPTRTPIYRLKKRLMVACLGIEIVEL